jgi:hypothetical protein
MSYVKQVDGKRMYKLLYCNHIFCDMHKNSQTWGSTCS